MKDPASNGEETRVILVGGPSEESGGDIERAVDRLGGEERVTRDGEARAEPDGEATPEKAPVRSPPPKRRGALRKRIMLWLACYSLVAIMYIGFFSYPVQPARLEGLAYVASEKVYMPLPYTYEIDYVSLSEKSVVVVLTVRTIQIPDRAYSAAMRSAEGIAEDYLRDQYGVEVDVRFSGESTTSVQGHAALRQDYDVYKTFTRPLGLTETLKVAKMSVLAWFCNENFFSVAAGFFHRAGASPAITENLRCH